MIKLQICLLALIGYFSYIKSFIPSRVARLSPKLSMKLMDNFDALLFDCDGVIAETERDCHRITFNQAFKSKGLKDEWGVELYGNLLKTGGGKERMKVYFDQVGWPTSVPEEDRKAFVQDLHNFKTNQFKLLVESGVLPLRPGVQRLVDEAFAQEIPVAVCSTSNDAAVTAIVKTLLGDERLSKIKIFAGDVVEKKKPAPDVYLLAAKTLGVEPSRCWVVEDSEIGLKAAKAAGMNCVVTKSVYTKDEDFEGADVCIDDLDHGLDGPVTITYLNYKASPRAFKPKEVADNAELFGAGSDTKVADMFSRIAKGDMGKGSPFGM